MAQRQTEEAAVALRRHGERLGQARAKLAELEAFRGEYAAQREAAMRGGMTAAGLRNFEVFLSRLDEAVAAQAGEVERLERVWDMARRHWETLRQREQAFDVLAGRHEARELQAGLRLEQKLQDEISSHRARRARD